MRAMAVRSIPLSRTTREAWKSAGVVFARRDRDTASILSITPPDVPILNLGSSSFSLGDTDREVWNDAENIAPLLTPAATRGEFGRLLPPSSWQGSGFYWEKYPGRAGRGKTRWYLHTSADLAAVQQRAHYNNGDVQYEVEGQEYRVITVNDKVVQVNARTGENGAREYSWVGVINAPRPVKDVAREAARSLRGNTVVAWDTILTADQDAFIFEGNSCPGVNEATARRIIDAMTGVRYSD